MQSPRVVITAMGVISPLGLDIPIVWQNLAAGKSGIGPITVFDTTDFDVRIAGEVRDFDPTNYMPGKDVRRTDHFTHYAIAALEQVLAQARLEINAHNAYDIGAMVGSGVGGIWTYSHEFEVLHGKGQRRVSPFLIPSITVDVPSVHIAIRTGAQGPNHGVASACATGGDAIGEAFEVIRRGHAQAMFTGGVEAAVTPIGVAAFDRLRALSRRNDDPQGASRPFDAGRDGFIMSDGGAILLLENLDFARRRGAQPVAEILSYASTSDAVHLTAPDMEGMGAARCMSLALQRAGLAPEQVSYINAHGTSTPSGDRSETRAIKQVFGEYARRIPISSTKSMTGHLLGGAGALEAVICALAMQHGLLPPTINLQNPDPACDLDYVPNQARRQEVQTAMSNSFGFGGHNTTLVLRAWQE